MSDEAAPVAKAGPPWKEWLPSFSLLAIVLGFFLAIGKFVDQTTENTRRITDLETKVESIHQIDVRTTRIEAKLDMLASDQSLHGARR